MQREKVGKATGVRLTRKQEDWLNDKAVELELKSIGRINRSDIIRALVEEARLEDKTPVVSA